MPDLLDQVASQPASGDLLDQIAGQTTAGGAFGRGVATGVVPSFGALGGAETGAAVGAAIPGLGEIGVGEIGGAIVGGIIGSLLADKAQNAALKKVAPDTFATLQKYQQQDLKDHPVASALGNIAGGLPAFRVGNPVQTAKEAAAMYKLATGQATTDAERAAAKNLAAKIGLGAAEGVAAPLAQGQKPTAGEITQGVAQTLLFGTPRFGGKVPENVSDQRLSGEADPTQTTTAPVTNKAGETLAKPTNQPVPNQPIPKEQNASTIPSPTGVPQPEVRSLVGEAAPLRQQGQVAQAQENPATHGGARSSGVRSPQGNAKLIPALLVDGKPVTGGDTHTQIFQNVIKDPAATPETLEKITSAFENEKQHVFVDQDGDVYNRKDAAKVAQRSGVEISNPERGLQSQDLLRPTKTGEPDYDFTRKDIQAQGVRDAVHNNLTPADVPRLEALRKAATDKIVAFGARDPKLFQTEQGKGIYYSGMIEGANRKGPNFDALKAEFREKLPGIFKPGPGAQTVGEPDYPPISVLTDQIKAAQRGAPGTSDKLSVGDQVADAWANGKSSVQRAIAKMLPVGDALKGIARGVRTPTDLDQRLGKLDRILQQSVGRSLSASKAIKQQVPDRTMRDAAMLWLDNGGDEGRAAMQDALARLPAKTSPRVRRAMQMAIDLPEPARNLAHSIEQYYGVRGGEALSEGVVNRLLEDYATHIWKDDSNTPEKVKDAISNGRISTYFQFGRQRKIGNFLDGILAGKTPELDAADIVPYYNHQLDRAIASRQFIKDATESMSEKDERPTFAPSGVRTTIPKEGVTEATLIKPRGKGSVPLGPEDPEAEARRMASINDYKSVDHPAMRKWKYAGTDENGKPIYYQADLLVHPDAYERIARIMDKGRLTPTKAGRAALAASTQIKGFKLGLFSLFHPVHVGSHALFHWTNPFKQIRGGELDFDSPDVAFALEKGHLKLAPSEQELNNFADGVLNNKLLIQKIPFIGSWSRANAEWTFKQFIPKLKTATFLNAYRRNIWARDNMPAKVTGLKGLSDDEIAARVGDSVNNAYGELNHMFLGKEGRNPRFQRLLRGIFLAPDFGEARLRFVTKAATKAGFEERMALATMFTTMYLAARVGNLLANGDPQTDWKHAFEVKVGNHWWGIRSVIGDLNRMFADSGRFMYVRLNPLYARPLYDWLVGRDPNGMKLTTTQKLVTRPLQQLVPIQLSGLTRPDQEAWESFVTAMGLQTTRDYPQADIDALIDQFKRNSNDPKLQAEWERSQSETFGQSDYAPLRYALILDNSPKAFNEYQKLIQQQGKTRGEIFRALNPNAPLTRSAKLETAFKKSLDADGMKKYNAAKQQQRDIFDKLKSTLDEFASSSNAVVPPNRIDAMNTNAVAATNPLHE